MAVKNTLVRSLDFAFTFNPFYLRLLSIVHKAELEKQEGFRVLMVTKINDKFSWQ